MTTLKGLTTMLKRSQEEMQEEQSKKKTKLTCDQCQEYLCQDEVVMNVLINDLQPTITKFNRMPIPTWEKQYAQDMKLTKADLVNRLNHYRKVCIEMLE